VSHCAQVELDIRDADAIVAACRRLGLEFRANQKTFKWYGEFVGDSPLPPGFTIEDLGKCDHAIGVPGNPDAYEVGLVQRRDGRPGFVLLFDYWQGGHGLMEKVGKNCVKLKQAYAAEVALKQARMQGFAVREEQRADGSLRLTLTR